jgi:23S rRNA pseudouridine2457 synthase
MPRPIKQRRKTAYQQRRNAKSKDSQLVLLNKPFNTLCQFKGETHDSTLADFVDIKDVYPAGRLDKDSEGLLLLTNDGKLQNQISHPDHKMEKTYWVQVEGDITDDALAKLENGIQLKDGLTKPATAILLDINKLPITIWQRSSPVRYRKDIPTSWISLSIKEGKNRQVRRMTAAVGFPTLRLIRYAVGKWSLGTLKPGEYRVEKP